MNHDFDYMDEYYKLIREIGEEKEIYLIGFKKNQFKKLKK